MLKNIKSGISHLNPKGIHLPPRKGSKDDGDAEANTHGGDDSSQGAPAPPKVAVGPKSVPPPRGPPGKMPPGVIMKGPPPPGMKVIKGPPPGEVMRVMSSGTGAVSPPRPGPGMPVGPGGNGTTPPGMKVMTHPPPGAKLISGSPPRGAKVVLGAPPPGSKIIQGSPPPGAKVVYGAPPPGAKMIPGPPPPGAVRPNSPSVLGPKMAPPRNNASPPPGMMSKTPTTMSPPSGVKVIHGPPPPGSRPISPENARLLSGNSSLIPSRAISPTNPPVFRILPNGVKVMVRAPPAGSPVKVFTKSPPGRMLSPTPPSMTPPKKMLIKSMVPNRSPPPMIQAPSSGAPSPSNSQVMPQNNSFSVGPPPPSSQATENLPRPTPVRPAPTTVKATPPEATPSNPDTNSSLHVPHPNVVSGRNGSQQELLFVEEEGGTNASDGDDIHFDEGSLLSPPQAPREAPRHPSARKGRSEGSSASSSSASSFSVKQDTDEATALPPARKGREAPASSAASLQSSHRSKPVSESKEEAQEKKNKRGHHSSSGHNGAATSAADVESRKERRKHHHRHHRSRSSETSSQQSYRVSAAAESDAASGVTADDAARRMSPRQLTAQGRRGEDDVDGAEGRYGAQLHETAFSPQALTSTSRNRIAEDFLSMLCPQQYYGKVKKINRIRPFKANRAAVTGLRNYNSIYVATKGTMPNPFFYPQLRLRDSDGEQPTGLTADETVEGAVDTPIILYEAAPGNMLFAETELDARRLLESSTDANSCFMLSNSAILFKDPEHYVLPIASLNVHWVPYSSPQSEPQCPIHKRELQLFDPYSKELVCALCASRNGIPMSNFVVIPDVLGNTDSRQTIHTKVSAQLDEAQQSARRWVEQHQRVRELCENKKAAIRNQFDLLIEALEAKKKEYTEACDAEFAYTQTDVAREILITDEKVQLLKAASDHLRADPSRPLFSMQIATIAEGLSAATDLPSRFTRNSLQLPPMSAGLVPNLEGIMAEVLELSASAGVGGGGSRSRPRSTSHVNSPYHSHQTSAMYRNPRPVDDTVIAAGGGPRRRSAYSASQGSSGGFAQRQSRSASANQQPRMTPLRNSAVVVPFDTALPPSPSGAAALRDESSRLSSSSLTQRRSANGVGPPSRYVTDAVSVPNSTGTSLFDFPLHELLSTFDASNLKKRSPRYIQWAIRVEDPGDWVGLGVGVGNTIDAWEQGSTNDLSHLWIVPASMTGSVLCLRVTVQPSSGHARLTVHDARGKQLDDGEVPQWNAARPSYPQATFGGHVGIVRMIEVPHAVR
ncbi:hypothetical protein ABB37_01192 [Leptomonas pyrrhocoris]|uniref:Uncharacterized protein n=1 Tax=Leptomonas pyrrhocoris TaxID=157538 RepID=A0A0N0VHB3_LEPPY|nr:hypothetical protein ABB37_01192 [Leptomonas pyrrhocoris]KPA84684.1 hypothetical protein ABB37_01192 [Leptomonas pyrrhocoris]|eukprot:XP_015663123.1 hypothetical protein ABB37_01192 [Leptomonas pyrrhocoris]